MTVDRFGRKAVVALVVSSVLSACSPPASTAVPPVAAAAPTTNSAVSAPLVQGLPDFTRLVDLYGPAVVNVQVSEARATPTQGRGVPRGMDPNDPFSEFFRRFGIPGAPGAPGAPVGGLDRPGRHRSPMTGPDLDIGHDDIRAPDHPSTDR